MLFGSKILEYKEELLADLDRLMRFESVDGAGNGGCEDAMDFVIARARDFGLTAEKVTDKSCHVQLGEGGRLCDIAPTLLDLMGLPIPPEMTGRSLISK